MRSGFAFTKFANRLASMIELSSEDLDLLAKMPATIGHFGSHETIARKGERPTSCCLLLQGYLCWIAEGETGHQITSIHVPGDIPDLQALPASQLQYDLVALGPVVVAFVPHAFFRELKASSAQLSRALSLLALVDIWCLRNWICNLGTRDALARVAHLLCEVTVRLHAVGQAKDYTFASPFTQSDLAAACAISAVHANRTIQELRRRRLVQWQSKTITITDWPGLVQLARFQPDYLGLRELSMADSAANGTVCGRAQNVMSQEGSALQALAKT